MKFGLVARMQAPKPWPAGEHVDHRIHRDTLAEAVGFDHCRATEHHFCEEIARGSARGVPGGPGRPDDANPAGPRGRRPAVQPSTPDQAMRALELPGRAVLSRVRDRS